MSSKVIPPEVIASLQKYDSPTISNAIEHFSVRDPVDGYANMQLRCQLPDNQPMVGYAVTVTADSTTRSDDRPLQLEAVFDAVRAAPKPVVLVVQDVGSDKLRSCFVGDMLCTALQRCEAVGVVTDGGFRDLAGIAERAPGFQLFSPGAVVSHGHAVFLQVGGTVTVCGLTVNQGDLLHGDASGLVGIPLDIAESVPQQAQKVRDAELEYFDFMQADAFDYEEFKRRIASH